jgi:hypothetical protein
MPCKHCGARDIHVWSYWTGPQPAAIGLCLETLRRNSPTAVILDDAYWTSGDYAGEIPTGRILDLAPNLRSDILRAWLLYRHGGIWIDADAIVWRDLRPIGKHLRRHDFVAYRGRGMGLCSALIAARRGSPLAAAYWQAVCRRVANGGRLAELSIGPRLLKQTIAQLKGHRLKLLRPGLVHPIPPRRSARLWREPEWTPPPGSWCFMLTHRPLARVSGLDRQQILDSPTLLGSLFRRALAVSALSPE